MNATFSQIKTLVSQKNFCPWENLDSTKQKEITQNFASPTNPQCIVYPQNPQWTQVSISLGLGGFCSSKPLILLRVAMSLGGFSEVCIIKNLSKFRRQNGED